MEAIDVEVRSQQSPTVSEGMLPPPIPGGVKSHPLSTPTVRRAGSSAEVDAGGGGVGDAKCGRTDGIPSGENRALPRTRTGEPGRPFILRATHLAEEDEEEIEDDVSTVTESTHLGLDDEEAISMELGIEPDDRGNHEGGSDSKAHDDRQEADDSTATCTTPSTVVGERLDPMVAEHRPSPTLVSPTKPGAPGPAAAFDVPAAGGGGNGGGGVDDQGQGTSSLSQSPEPTAAADAPPASPSDAPAADMSRAPKAPGAPVTAFPAATSSGPGAVARSEGWSDRELLRGLIQPEDATVVIAHDVSRSVGGVEVKRGLLVVCNNTLHCVDGFGIGPRVPPPGGSGAGGQAATGAASAASVGAGGTGGVGAVGGARKKDPLHGVRRLEAWELGGGAGSIGGGDESHGEGGAGTKIQVTLRKKSTADVAGLASAAAAGSAASREAGKGGAEGGGQGTPKVVTAEQAGSTEGGEGPGEVDEIVTLGHVDVHRIPLDQVSEGVPSPR